MPRSVEENYLQISKEFLRNNDARKNSSEIIELTLRILSLLPETQFAFGRTKSEESALYNILKTLFNGEKIDPNKDDTNGLKVIAENPVLYVEKLKQLKYEGIPVFNFIKEREKNFNKDNGYKAYHIGVRINPEFLEKVVNTKPERNKNTFYKIKNFLSNKYKVFFQNATPKYITNELNKKFQEPVLEIIVQDWEAYVDSEFGESSHSAYKNNENENWLIQLLLNKRCGDVKKEFEVISSLCDKNSIEYKVLVLLYKYNNTAITAQIFKEGIVNLASEEVKHQDPNDQFNYVLNKYNALFGNSNFSLNELAKGSLFYIKAINQIESNFSTRLKKMEKDQKDDKKYLKKMQDMQSKGLIDFFGYIQYYSEVLGFDLYEAITTLANDVNGINGKSKIKYLQTDKKRKNALVGQYHLENLENVDEHIFIQILKQTLLRREISLILRGEIQKNEMIDKLVLFANSRKSISKNIIDPENTKYYQMLLEMLKFQKIIPKNFEIALQDICDTAQLDFKDDFINDLKSMMRFLNSDDLESDFCNFIISFNDKDRNIQKNFVNLIDKMKKLEEKVSANFYYIDKQGEGKIKRCDKHELPVYRCAEACMKANNATSTYRELAQDLGINVNATSISN